MADASGTIDAEMEAGQRTWSCGGLLDAPVVRVSGRAAALAGRVAGLASGEEKLQCFPAGS